MNRNTAVVLYVFIFVLFLTAAIVWYVKKGTLRYELLLIGGFFLVMGLRHYQRDK